MNIWGFDPTPKSLEYIAQREELKFDGGLFHLIPQGLATFRGNLPFTNKPKQENYVSMRAGVHANGGSTIHVPVNTLENWMHTN